MARNDGNLFAIDPIDPTGYDRGFIKPCGLIPIGAAPLVKTGRSDMGTINAIFKPAQTIVPPGTSQINAARLYAVLASEMATAEGVAFGLPRFVGGCSYITTISHIHQRTDPAIFKECLATAKDKVYGAFDEAVAVDLGHGPTAPQFVQKKTFVATD